MLISSLFLGYPIDSHLESALIQQNSFLIDQFIGVDPSYLRKIEYQGISYLGKAMGSITDLTSLLLVEENIYSLIKTLAPHISVKENPLFLFATLNEPI